MARQEPTTPGERVLDALGHLYEHWRSGAAGAVAPGRLDVEAVARLVGVSEEVEFIQGGPEDAKEEGRTHIHFGSEVLTIDPSQEFPWRLEGVMEWAGRQERRAFWRYFH